MRAWKKVNAEGKRFHAKKNRKMPYLFRPKGDGSRGSVSMTLTAIETMDFTLARCAAHRHGINPGHYYHGYYHGTVHPSHFSYLCVLRVFVQPRYIASRAPYTGLGECALEVMGRARETADILPAAHVRA